MIPPQAYNETMAGLMRKYPLLGNAILVHRTIRGQAMSFKERPYQVEQYADFPKIEGADIVKAVQTGQSEMFIVMGLHDAGWRGRIFAYVLPTDAVRNRLVSTRVNPLLSIVPSYRLRLPGAEEEALEAGDSGSLAKKRFGRGLLLFLGARTDGNFVELTADTFVVDEYDSSRAVGERNLVRVVDRMKESPDPRHFRLGNPELPGGIEALFEAGDMRLFHWQCEHCNERQPIDWLINVVDRNEDGSWRLRDPEAHRNPDAPVLPVCRRCGRTFHRRVEGAAWVPEQMLRTRRSYRVTRFDVMHEPLRKLWNEWLEAQASTLRLREWYRRNAGRLHTEASSQLTRQQLQDAAYDGRMDYVGGDRYEGRAVTLGGDIGSLIHLSVSESIRDEAGNVVRRCVWTGTVRSKEQVLDVLKRYRVRTAVLDQDPETRLVEQIQEDARKFGCTVWLCRFYSQARTTEQRFGLKALWKTHEVRVDRTQAFDVGTELIHAGAAYGRMISEGKQPGQTLEGLRVWPADVLDVLGWVPQMTAPIRVQHEGVIRWDEGDKADHFRLAELYDLVAFELDGMGAMFFEME